MADNEGHGAKDKDQDASPIPMRKSVEDHLNLENVGLAEQLEANTRLARHLPRDQQHLYRTVSHGSQGSPLTPSTPKSNPASPDGAPLKKAMRGSSFSQAPASHKGLRGSTNSSFSQAPVGHKGLRGSTNSSIQSAPERSSLDDTAMYSRAVRCVTDAGQQGTLFTEVHNPFRGLYSSPVLKEEDEDSMDTLHAWMSVVAHFGGDHGEDWESSPADGESAPLLSTTVPSAPLLPSAPTRTPKDKAIIPGQPSPWATIPYTYLGLAHTLSPTHDGLCHGLQCPRPVCLHLHGKWGCGKTGQWQ